MRQGNRSLALFALSLMLLPAAHAADKPPAEAANRVVDYYYGDANEPLLLAFKLCKGVHEQGPQKHNCTEELDRESIDTGTTVYLWMKYLVPREANATVLTQLNHKGITRQTFNRDLDGALRYRTWHRATMDSAGQWEISVFHEQGDGVTKLHSSVVEVE